MARNLARTAAVSVLLSALSGCVLPPAGGYYPPQQSGYAAPQSGYAAPQVGYTAPQPDPYPEQYVYTDGTPYAVVGGQQYVVLFDPGLGWGFYDGYHRWHGAPPRWRDDFERRYPSGRGYAPAGRPEFHREEGYQGRPGLGRPGPGGPPAAYARPEGGPPPRLPPPGRPGEPADRGPGPGPATRVAAPVPQPQRPQPERAQQERPQQGRPGREGCGAPGQPHC